MQQETMQMVTEFHRTFDPQSIRDTPGICDPRYFDFRLKFLDEERQETLKAQRVSDLVEIADGLGDMRYVLYGMILNFGLQREMVVPQISYNYNIKLGYYLNAFDAELTHMVYDYESGDMVRIATGIANMDQLLNEAEKAAGLSDVMPAVIAEIHRSNMTKCCATAKEADDSVLVLFDEYGICYKELVVGDRYVVRRLSDGKIMKPIGYQKRNLAAAIQLYRAENPLTVDDLTAN